MRIGFLTACMRKRPLREVVDFAEKAGFTDLEVSAGPGYEHVDINKDRQELVESLRGLFAGRGVQMTALAMFWDTSIDAGAERDRMVANYKKGIELCGELGVKVITTLAGMTRGSQRKLQRLETHAAPFFREVLPLCGQRGVKLAIENWWGTLCETPVHWARLFELVPDPNLGLEFDPSHLVALGIDPIATIRRFADRIFYTHAKDTVVFQDKVGLTGRHVECFGEWARYAIPGYGQINWGEYIGQLRLSKYDGVLSIEHEDAAFGPEEGLMKGLAYLKRLI